MTMNELFIIAVGLSMDAFAVSICKGLALEEVGVKPCINVGLYFGVFQGMMPFIGYIIGSYFADSIIAVDHWIAFVLLAIIGGKMIKESFEKECSKDGCEDVNGSKSLSFMEMIPLAIATSIDALAVGVTLAFLNVSIVPAVLFIGIITFSLSAIGVKVGNIFGIRFRYKAEFAGGLILILMGAKILFEHLGML